MRGAAGAEAGTSMKRIVIIVMVVGLAAFTTSVAVRSCGRDDRSNDTRKRPDAVGTRRQSPGQSNENILRPADFFAIGSIKAGQDVMFDTGGTKSVQTVTIGPNTLRGEVKKIGGVRVAVFCFNDVHLDRPVRVKGKLPLAVVSKGSIVIKTRISVSGAPAGGAAAGVGVCGGYDGGFGEGNGLGPGGGGAGRGAGGGSYGGRGGDGRMGKATATYGLSPIFRMQGGSGGGGGLGGGGAGGGAIQLAAGTAIEIGPAGSILADGGDGATHSGGGGGGGSGGGILLTAPQITIHGNLSARGGNGGHGGNRGAGAGGGGRIAVYFAGSFTGNMPSPTRNTPGGKGQLRGWNGQAGTTVPLLGIAWWTFDEIRPGAKCRMAIDAVDKKNGHHAMLWKLDELASVPGVCGNGLQLDGEAGYVEVFNRDPILRLGRGSMTLALWVKTEILAEKAVLVGKGMPMVEGGQLLAQWVRAGYGKRFVIQKRGDSIVFAVEAGAIRSAVSVRADQVETGSWVHLAAVRDAEAKMLSIFVNGQKLAEAPDSTGDVSSGFNLYLGAGEDGAVKNYARVTIDDVRVFTEALGGDALRGLIQHAAASGGRIVAAGPAEPGEPLDDWIDPSLSDKERKALERVRDRNRRKAEADRRRAEILRRSRELAEARQKRLEDERRAREEATRRRRD